MYVSVQEVLGVRKDKDRADAMRAVKLAWEQAEPGRAAKAKQSRLNYLSTHVLKVCISICCVSHFMPLNLVYRIKHSARWFKCIYCHGIAC